MIFSRCVSVRTLGLRRQPHWNGTVGLVKQWLDGKERFAVIPPRGDRLLLVQSLNMNKYACDETTGGLSAIAFWPETAARKRDNIPTHALQGWPTNTYSGEGWPLSDHAQRTYLRDTLSWSDPQCLGGVTSRGQPKPDFVMYYDAGDDVSPANGMAERVAALMPSWERSKVPAPPSGYRGVCVLEYAPTIRQTFGSHSEWSPPVASRTPTLKFTLAELREALLYQSTEDAEAMYARHNDPMHCVLGGL